MAKFKEPEYSEWNRLTGSLFGRQFKQPDYNAESPVIPLKAHYASAEAHDAWCRTFEEEVLSRLIATDDMLFQFQEARTALRDQLERHDRQVEELHEFMAYLFHELFEVE